VIHLTLRMPSQCVKVKRTEDIRRAREIPGILLPSVYRSCACSSAVRGAPSPGEGKRKNGTPFLIALELGLRITGVTHEFKGSYGISDPDRESHRPGDTRRISYARPWRAKGTPSRRGRRHGGHAAPPLRA
jgi:hypothetical protein